MLLFKFIYFRIRSILLDLLELALILLLKFVCYAFSGYNLYKVISPEYLLSKMLYQLYIFFPRTYISYIFKTIINYIWCY